MSDSDTRLGTGIGCMILTQAEKRGDNIQAFAAPLGRFQGISCGAPSRSLLRTGRQSAEWSSKERAEPRTSQPERRCIVNAMSACNVSNCDFGITFARYDILSSIVVVKQILMMRTLEQNGALFSLPL
ncbi:hypothetical protein ACJ72_01154 [Emergomyces africanus]|uniref:Uncharacterized protein n=1 Tax=Emergomyces africanus TaxID=1955775 RepID=A0A1B7P662_9EURO|nr:hypothetical protein ACJ72_01154 [Emergomyces africanus]